MSIFFSLTEMEFIKKKTGFLVLLLNFNNIWNFSAVYIQNYYYLKLLFKDSSFQFVDETYSR